MKKLSFSLPADAEHVVGVTIPTGGKFFVCNHDDVWEVTLAPSPRVLRTGFKPYPFVTSRTDFLGIEFAGTTPGMPVLQAGNATISYDIVASGRRALVQYEAGRDKGELQDDLLGGWFVATLSTDGTFLVLAEPHNVVAYEFT